MTMSINFLSILLSLAMMLTGAAGLETETAMGAAITIRDFYLDYNDVSVALEPSVTAGVSTENGAAIFDLSMACGEESLFPLQLIVTEDNATVVAEKAGKAFTIDAETLNGIINEALDLDAMMSSEEVTAAMEEMKAAWAEALNAAEPDEEAIAALEAQIAEMLQPVETSAAVDNYNDAEYEVTSSKYVLDNEQMFELVDIVFNASEEAKKAHDEMIASVNSTLEQAREDGEEIPEITSIRDIYEYAGITLSMELTENATEDGAFIHTTGVITFNGEELPQPIEVNLDVYEVDGATDLLVESEFDADGMGMYMGVMAYNDDAASYFDMIIDVMPEESEDLTDEDYEDAVSLSVSGGATKTEEDNTAYNFTLEANTYGFGFALIIDGAADAEGESSTNVGFEYADETNNVSAGFTIDTASTVFANAAEGLEPIIVDPANMEALEGELSAVAGTLMVDLQSLVENESVTDLIAAFTAINTAEVGAEEVTTVEIADNTESYEYDYEAVNTELSFNEPQFTYLPEGLVMEDYTVDTEYNSVSCTISDESYDNVYYVYIYGDLYTENPEAYTIAADGTLTPIEDRVLTISTEDDAIYGEMTDGNIIVSISYYGEDMGLEEMSKVLAGMTY